MRKRAPAPSQRPPLFILSTPPYPHPNLLSKAMAPRRALVLRLSKRGIPPISAHPATNINPCGRREFSGEELRRCAKSDCLAKKKYCLGNDLDFDPWKFSWSQPRRAYQSVAKRALGIVTAHIEGHPAPSRRPQGPPFPRTIGALAKAHMDYNVETFAKRATDTGRGGVRVVPSIRWVKWPSRPGRSSFRPGVQRPGLDTPEVFASCAELAPSLSEVIFRPRRWKFFRPAGKKKKIVNRSGPLLSRPPPQVLSARLNVEG